MSTGIINDSSVKKIKEILEHMDRARELLYSVEANCSNVMTDGQWETLLDSADHLEEDAALLEKAFTRSQKSG
jgi:hypothetical protein